MKQIIVTGIDEDMHRHFKIFCARKGISIQAALREAIRKVSDHEKSLSGVSKAVEGGPDAK